MGSESDESPKPKRNKARVVYYRGEDLQPQHETEKNISQRPSNTCACFKHGLFPCRCDSQKEKEQQAFLPNRLERRLINIDYFYTKHCEKSCTSCGMHQRSVNYVDKPDSFHKCFIWTKTETRCLSRNFLRLIQQISKSESKTRAYEQSTDRERNMGTVWKNSKTTYRFGGDEMFLRGKPHDDRRRISVCLTHKVDGGAFIDKLLLWLSVSDPRLAAGEIIGLKYVREVLELFALDKLGRGTSRLMAVEIEPPTASENPK
ncbi:hypothetical protein DNTS_021273 [Danionella cerebrum]|uniref:Uncharacterized protein n=1 Tax=Danionella cerebrum TaxID=2873325 RepID=A0A553MM77_9TELE|nr:hypothetical protein DNTS_021273 [Danionella translucida]